MTDELPHNDRSGDSTEPAHVDDADRRRLKRGEKLGNRFVIVQFLAQGGMGEVYEAADLQLHGKHCALKTLRSDLAKNAAFRARFEREVLLAREVNHYNVCPTYDLFNVTGSEGPITFLTMKLLRGESLLSRLQRSGRLSLDDVLAIARQMANALDAAHSVGVIHRDLKPGNVMIESSKSGELHVSITDFGLSRAYEGETTVADTGHILGTPGYIAPELLQGRVAGFGADIYAFGVVLYEMITGNKPVTEPGTFSIVAPSAIVLGLPRVWDKVVLGCLEIDPAKRFQSAQAALAVLDGAGKLSSPPKSRFVSQSRKWVASIIVAAVIFVVLWLTRSELSTFFHPLPKQKFVALMPWPETDAPTRALLKGVLETIESRLARAETTTKDLLIISTNDISGTTLLSAPTDAVGTLGANLVLAASMHKTENGVRLELAVLDATTSRQLRKVELRTTNLDVSHLPERAAIAAARLLDVQLKGPKSKDSDEIATVAPVAYQSFASAEELVAKPNDTGLDQAIQNYQKALEADPTFALAYARLSMAFSRKFQTSSDRAALTLAERNAGLAMRYHPTSGKSVLSRAIVDMYSGQMQAALDGLERAITLEPGNPQILLFKAQALRSLDRAVDEQLVYRQILQERPNYWPAYNELGFTFYRRGQYQQAVDAFREGSAVAPHVATLLANQGAMYLLLDKPKDAEEAFRRSLEQAPNAVAYSNLGTLAFQAGDYRKALDYYSKERDLRPRNDVAWRNIADCYAMLGDSARMTEAYSKAAELMSDNLRTNAARGSGWMNLAFYEAKLGHIAQAESALHSAEDHGASDLQSQFKRAQILELLGRHEEALRVVLECLDKGLARTDVELALDLKELRKDRRYLQHNRVANH